MQDAQLLRFLLKIEVIMTPKHVRLETTKVTNMKIFIVTSI